MADEWPGTPVAETAWPGTPQPAPDAAWPGTPVEAPSKLPEAPSAAPMVLREENGKMVAAPETGPVNAPEQPRGILQRILGGFEQGGGGAVGEYHPKGESPAMKTADTYVHETMALPGRVLGAGTGVVAGILEKLGMAPASADKMQRDLGVAAQVAVPEMARGITPKQAVVRRGKEVADPARPVENPQVAETPAAAAQPPTPPAMAETVYVGPGSFKTTSLAGKSLYHETGAGSATTLLTDDLTNSTGQARPANIFVADNPDIAIGQGGRGIRIEYDGAKISGKENAKPGTGDLTGREYRTNAIGQDAIKSVLVGLGETLPLKPAWKARFESVFEPTPQADGSVLWTRKTSSSGGGGGQHPPGGTSGSAPGMGHNNPPPGPLSQAQQNVLSRIAPQPKTKTSVGELSHDAYTQLVDDLHPIKRIVEEGTAAAEDPYVQFRLTRGSAGKAEHMLRYGTFDFANPDVNTGRPLIETLKPMEKDREGFTAYLLSKRAVELDQRGIDTGIPLADAQAVVAQGAQKYGAAAKALDDFQEQTLKYFKDSGIVSQEAFDNMRNASASYIPLYRAFEAEPTAKRFNVSNTIKRLTGSDEKILDPIDSIIRNTYVLTEMAERNRAATSLVKHGQQAGIPMQKVSATAKPISLSPGEIDRIMADHGVPQSVYGQAGSADIFRPDRKAGLNKDEFAVYENGKRTVYKTTPEIAEAVKRMDDTELSIFTKMAAVPARMLRAGVTLDPGYMGSNLIRDQLSAVVQSKSNYRPGIDTLSGAWSRAIKDKSYRDWLKSGGSQSTMVAQDRDYTTKFLRAYGAKPDLLTAIKDAGGKPIEILRDISEAVDNMTRIGEFKQARKKGADLPEAGFRAREVTQDFQRMGSKMRAWNAMTSFAGGQIQGLDREFRNFKDRPFAASGKAAAYITLPSLYLWYANKDDPRYQNASNEVKDSFWLWLPDDPKAEPIKIPKGFSTGMAFSAPIERTLDMYFKDRPEALKGLASNLGLTMRPNIVPTVVQPIADQASNQRGFFSGRETPLLSARNQRLPAPEQVTQGTSDTARAIGKATGTSPVILDNYMNAWGGQIGNYIKMGSDAALRSLGAVDARPDAPAGKLSTIPGLRRFVMQYPSANAQPIRDFYDKYTELEKAYNSNKEERRRGGTGAGEVMRLAGFKRQLDNLHREVRETYDAKDLSPSAKRTKIDEAYIKMLDTAQRGLQMVRQRNGLQ